MTDAVRIDRNTPAVGEVTRAEIFALALMAPLVTGVTLPYFLDLFGLPLLPRITLIIAAGVALIVARQWRFASTARVELLVAVLGGLGTWAFLLSQTWPALLPPGSGPDLTHHLLLIDYLQRTGSLVRDPAAAAALGEMAHYPPGVHLLAVLAGALVPGGGVTALYPVVAFCVALKFSFFFLILLRLLPGIAGQTPLAATGAALVVCVSTYTFGSFLQDSFLAQVVAELFAIAMWWTLIVWFQRPSAWSMGLFGACGVAAFLTWPVWVGVPCTALVFLIVARRDLPWSQRVGQAVRAMLPIAAVTTIHAASHGGAFGLIATGGAVSQPSLTSIRWWLPVLALVGVMRSWRRPAVWPLFALIGATGLQAALLWWVAATRGATNPYMAVKMIYLGVYPLIALAVIGVSAGVGGRPGSVWRGGLAPATWNAVIAVTLFAVATRDVSHVSRHSPDISADMWRAGLWARDHLPGHCVDYLVGNEYTAYWLHLAVLRNSRADARSTTNETYLTQPTVARWLVDRGVPYAIADLAFLPAEIRARTRDLYQVGGAVVIARDGECRAQ